MKIARVQQKENRKQTPFYVSVEKDTCVQIGNPYQKTVKSADQIMKLSALKFLAPCQPSKIICVGVNYANHAGEMNHELPEEPLIFLKPPTAVIGPEDEIIYPVQSQRVDYEAELALVIKKKGFAIPQKDAKEYILGCTCLNDVTARDLQKKDGQWTRAKGFDSFCPIGPWIDTEFDWSEARVVSRLNGEIKQDGNTKQLIFPVERIIEHISSIMTLYPGDVIATGTPAGIGPMKPGDVIEVEITGLGILTNHVKG